MLLFVSGSIYRRGARRWRTQYHINGHTLVAKRLGRVIWFLIYIFSFISYEIRSECFQINSHNLEIILLKTREQNWCIVFSMRKLKCCFFSSGRMKFLCPNTSVFVLVEFFKEILFLFRCRELFAPTVAIEFGDWAGKVYDAYIVNYWFTKNATSGSRNRVAMSQSNCSLEKIHLMEYRRQRVSITRYSLNILFILFYSL